MVAFRACHAVAAAILVNRTATIGTFFGEDQFPQFGAQIVALTSAARPSRVRSLMVKTILQPAFCAGKIDFIGRARGVWLTALHIRTKANVRILLARTHLLILGKRVCAQHPLSNFVRDVSFPVQNSAARAICWHSVRASAYDYML